MTTTQTDRLLAYLQQGNSITGLESWQKLGIYRLAARVYDIESRGIPVHRAYTVVRNKFGEDCRVKRYWIAPAYRYRAA